VVEQPSEIPPQIIENKAVKNSTKDYIKWAILGLLMSATGWMLADMLWGTPKQPPKTEPTVLEKGGYQVHFQDKAFDIYCVPMAQNGLQLLCTDEQKVPFRDVKTLKSYLQNQQKQLLFAMNAGMYTTENLPKGLYIEQKQTLFPLDTAQTGFGNFYLQPNGVFAFDDTSAVILDTKTFEKQQKQYTFATQSGPLLVINNQLNPVFTQSSNSTYIRNGVGTTLDGKIIFAISNQAVNFYTFALLFKERLNCPNALFLDGAISKMYAPDIQRMDLDGDLGPFVVLTRRD
jgi:uncharacterized protein YigE (DUF2233 family)